MKRLHVHLSVAELDPAIRFYSGMFGQPPTVRERDYAKWQLDDPCVNFAIRARGKPVGIEHLGIEAADASELDELRQRAAALDGRRHDGKRTTCCHAVSDKTWIVDPAGVPWELFHTVARVAGSINVGPDPQAPPAANGGGADPSCCR